MQIQEGDSAVVEAAWRGVVKELIMGETNMNLVCEQLIILVQLHI